MGHVGPLDVGGIRQRAAGPLEERPPGADLRLEAKSSQLIGDG